MKNYTVKFNHIFPPFLVVTLSTIFGMAFLRWLTTIQFDQVHLKQEVWNLYLAMGIPAVVSFIGLRPKFKLLVFKDDDEKGRTVFNIVAWAAMAIPIIISQQYLSTTFSKFITVESVDAIEDNRSLFYSIKSYEVAPVFALAVERSATGRRFNKQWRISVYFVLPITRGNEARSIQEYTWWYGMKFAKNISYTWSQEEVSQKTEAFIKQCESELRRTNFKNNSYFERLADSFERDKFREALRTKMGDEALNKEILIPKYGLPPRGNLVKLLWALFTYCLGLGVFLLLLDWPGYSTIELERMQKEKVLRQVTKR